MTALYPAPYMYKSMDHGKTWKLEKISYGKDSRGFMPIPNAACDSGINIKHGLIMVTLMEKISSYQFRQRVGRQLPWQNLE